MAVSFGLDSFLRLALEGRLRKRERLFEFLDFLTEQSENVLTAWIKLVSAIKSSRIDLPDGTQIDQSVDPVALHQGHCAELVAALYRSLSRVCAGKLSERELTEISDHAGSVLYVRLLLRSHYDDFRQHSQGVVTKALIWEFESSLSRLSREVALLKAGVMVLKSR